MKTAQLLDQYGLNLRKSFGQHFLSDDRVAQRIVQSTEIRPADTILEIGAGSGVLTSELLKTGNLVYAFEIDQRFETLLRDRFVNSPNFHLVIGDFLQYVAGVEILQTQTVFFGNLPYHISVAILQKTLFDYPCARKWVFMFQYEVAERLCAKPSSKSYGSLSVMVQTLTHPKITLKISKSNFKPSPKVDSAIVEMIPSIPSIPKDDQDAFFAFVRFGFSNRRKMLKKNYPETERIVRALESASLSLGVRAEELSVDQWIALYQQWKTLPGI